MLNATDFYCKSELISIYIGVIKLFESSLKQAEKNNDIDEIRFNKFCIKKTKNIINDVLTSNPAEAKEALINLWDRIHYNGTSRHEIEKYIDKAIHKTINTNGFVHIKIKV